MSSTIVVFGQNGINKRDLFETITKAVNGQAPPTSLTFADLEDFLPMPGFLFGSNSEHKAQKWVTALERSISVINTSKADVRALGIHLLLMRQGNISSPLSLPATAASKTISELVADLQPDLFVTLIDNVYSIQNRQRVLNNNFTHRLSELVLWRSLETMLADSLAKGVFGSDASGNALFSKSVAFARGHSIDTTTKLLREPHKTRCYLSFPITSTRRKPEAKEEIDRFRDFFARRIVSFDPLTVDERPLVDLMAGILVREIEAANSKRSEPARQAAERSDLFSLSSIYRAAGCKHYADLDDAKITSDMLWSPHSLSGDVPIKCDELAEITIPAAANRKSIIDSQIEQRDYRLIDQSDAVIIYRPQYGGRADWSGGTQREAAHAEQTFKPTFVIHDSKADGHLNTRAFRQETTYVIDQYSGLLEPLNQDIALTHVMALLTKDQALQSRGRQ